ncbi:hypothetical protein Clacol_009929 [Clathrus columnatus]|uniref:Uncharacterized protein n=1 Tax=Clathrus columnatus TaxID=1419009 RepID=A0AAV5ATI6_9AGAM|nr:hypothetical protein Clacol_009929 [Clathrus columnatus]
MSQCLGSKASARQLVESQENSVSKTVQFPLCLHSILNEELKKTTNVTPLPQEIIRLEWSSPANKGIVDQDMTNNNQVLDAIPPGSSEEAQHHLPSIMPQTPALLEQPFVATIDREEGEVNLPDEPSKDVQIFLSKRLPVTCIGNKFAWKSPLRKLKITCMIGLCDMKRHVHDGEGTSGATQQKKLTGRKRKHVHFEDSCEDQPMAKKQKKVEWLTDTTYRWTTHVDIKVEHAENLPQVSVESPKLASKTFDFTPTWEDDVVREGQEEDDSRIPVIRHVLLPNGTFHCETITFTVAWPPEYEQKQYFWLLLKNSRPAELSEGYAVQGGKESISENDIESSSTFQKSILPLSHFDCLEERNLNSKELEE